MNGNKIPQLTKTLWEMQSRFPWGIFCNNEPEDSGCVFELVVMGRATMLHAESIKQALCITCRIGESEKDSANKFGCVNVENGTFDDWDDESDLEKIYNEVCQSYPYLPYGDIELAFAELKSAVEAGGGVARLLAERLNNVLHRLQPDGKGQPISYQLCQTKVEAIEGEDGDTYQTLKPEFDERLASLCGQMEQMVSDGRLTKERAMIIYRLITKYDEQVTSILRNLQEYWDTYLADIMQQGEASTTAKETAKTPSESVSFDDGTIIQARGQKPSESLKKLFMPKYVCYADKLLAKDIEGKPKDRIVKMASIINEWSDCGICVGVYRHAPQWAAALKESTGIEIAKRTIVDYLRDFTT